MEFIRFNFNRSRKYLVSEYNAMVLRVQFVLDSPFISFRHKHSFCQLVPMLNNMYFELQHLLKAYTLDNIHAGDLSEKVGLLKIQIPSKLAKKLANITPAIKSRQDLICVI